LGLPDLFQPLGLDAKVLFRPAHAFRCGISQFRSDITLLVQPLQRGKMFAGATSRRPCSFSSRAMVTPHAASPKPTLQVGSSVRSLLGRCPYSFIQINILNKLEECNCHGLHAWSSFVRIIQFRKTFPPPPHRATHHSPASPVPVGAQALPATLEGPARNGAGVLASN
jgi:hypothetical protein